MPTIGESVLLEELLQVPTSYDTGKHIIQKDGRIFISNLKSNSFSRKIFISNITINYTESLIYSILE